MSRINVANRAIYVPHEAAAVQAFTPRVELERMVSCCLLGERQFYVDGQDIEKRILELCGKVEAAQISAVAVDARTNLGLRHVPLLLLVALAARPDGHAFIRPSANAILRTPKDAMDLVALYWKDGKKPLPHAFKGAIRDGFARWTDYQIAKYGTLSGKVSVRLRDLMFLAHPKPAEGRVDLFKLLAQDEIRAPDTWEAALSKPGADKCAEWTRLLRENKLGALALVRNLRNMEQVGVQSELVRKALEAAKAVDVWPWQALAAAREAPGYAHALDSLMVRSAGVLPRLPGRTGVLVDISGSMDASMSERGTMTRMDAGCGLAVVLREVCEAVEVGAFSNQCAVIQQPPRGAMLANAIKNSMPHGGTYLAQAVNAFAQAFPNLDRLVVLTDEQSHDAMTVALNLPLVVVNLASTQRGIDWHGKVTRINGWSGGVVRWLAQHVTGSVGETVEAD